MSIKAIIFGTHSSVKAKTVWMLALLLVLILIPLGIIYWRVDTRARLDDARQADAIIVLGCQVWPGGRPSPALSARTQHAIALYRAGMANHLIFTGGLGTYPPAESEVMRSLAIKAGIPEDALALDTDSHSTEENLTHAREILNERGWRSAIIVSDPYHIYRAQAMARDLGIDAFGSPASDSPTYTIPHLRVWYTARETLALVWYYGTRTAGEPAWLYGWLKGRF